MHAAWHVHGMCGIGIDLVGDNLFWTRTARQIFKYGIEDLKNSCTERKKTHETSACSARTEK